MSRVTQGVRLINLREGQKVSSISVVDREKEEEQPVDTSNNDRSNDYVELTNDVESSNIASSQK